MRPKLLFLIFLMSLLATFGVEAQTVYKAVLSSQQEVHPVVSKAYGSIEAILDGNMLMLSGEFGDLQGDFAVDIAGGAHIHLGLAGMNGDVSIVLNAQSSPDARSGTFMVSENTFELTNDQVMALESRRMYVNIHSTEFPAGEIRGQLLPDADFLGQALLTGHQEVPAVLTTGLGKVMVEINGNELTLSGSFSDLSTPFDSEVAGGAHIHLGSVGQNGGVSVILNANVETNGLSGRFEASSNTFTLDEETINNIINRETYINVHTTGFASGEIRGQITGMATQVFRAYLSGAQEKPFVDSRGQGAVLAEYAQADSTLSLFGSFGTLDFPVDTEIAGGAHIHSGMAGQNGPVAFLLDMELDSENQSGIFEQLTNRRELSAMQIEQLFNRGFYINIHSTGHQAGELRGQLLPLAQYHFSAYFGGSQEFPSVVSTGNGAVMVEWSGEEITLSGSFSDLLTPFDTEVAGGAHIHFGLPGQNGDIALMLNASLDDLSRSGTFMAEDNRYAIDLDIQQGFNNRNLYFNIHTTGFPSGEIRGQILHEAQAYYQSSLSGSQEVPSVLTTGRGAIILERRGNQLYPVGSFSGLESDFDPEIAGGAHIHIGYAGRNGDVLAGLTPNLTSDLRSGTFSPEDVIELDEEAYNMIANRELYVNIHTTDVPSGEIRGQITGQQVSLFRSFLSGTNEVPEVETNGHGSVVVELLNDGSIISSGSFNDLESPIDTDIAGGVHIHQGFAGSNGPVAVVLVVSETDGISGVFKGFENRFEVDSIALLALTERATYVNVHTLDHQAGEVRGQLNGDANYVFTANLSGAQEAPAVTSPGFGALKIEWNGNQIISSGSVSSLWDEIDEDIAGGAHIHMGLPGENGDIALMLNFSEVEDTNTDALFLPLDNTQMVSEEQAKMMAERSMYVNIHTGRYPSGEVRGQILREARAYYRSNLYGSHEVPSVMTTGQGAIQMEWSGQEVVAFGTFRHLIGSFDASIAGGAHIHTGLPGQNGPVLLGVMPTVADDLKSGVFEAESNTFETDEDFIKLIRDRELYFNIHTDTFPSGEIRGQVTGQSQALLRAYLAGGNEVPSVMSNGQGVVQAEYRSDGSMVVYGAFDSLDGMVDESIAGGAHIHAGFPGRNGDVLLPINATLDGDGHQGVFERQLIELETPENITLTLLRGTYVNVHTTSFAPGEIRGQLMGESQYEFTGILSGMQEVNPVLTVGNGGIKAEWSGNTVTVIGSVQNLFADIDLEVAGGVHLHSGLAGSNGPIVGMMRPELEFNPGNDNAVFIALDNIVSLDSSNIRALMDRELYVNIHSELYPNGEVRAQLLAERQGYLMSNLAASHEVSPVNSRASGTILFEKNGNELSATGSFTALSSAVDVDIAGGAHIHIGKAGQNGPVEELLNISFDGSRMMGQFLIENNTIQLSDSLIMERDYYVNIHTENYPGGELRGQLTDINITSFSANLDGMNEVPFIRSEAEGQVLMEFNGQSLTASGSFENLSTPVDVEIAGGVHVHAATVGENGPVSFMLMPNLSMDRMAGTFNRRMNMIDFTTDQLITLYSGGFYVNVHTTGFPDGELRGQLLPIINFFPSDEAVIMAPEDGEEVVIDGDPSKALMVSWSPAEDRDSLAYLWELSLDEDFDRSLLLLNVGTSTMLELDYMTVDQLLADNDVLEGGEVTLYHRAVATDGSLRTPAPGSSVKFVRGTITSTNPQDLSSVNLSIRPNVVSTGQEARIVIENDQLQAANLSVLNINGQIMKSQRVLLSNGITDIPLTINTLRPGTYFIQWSMPNGQSKLAKFIVN